MRDGMFNVVRYFGFWYGCDAMLSVAVRVVEHHFCWGGRCIFDFLKKRDRKKDERLSLTLSDKDNN